MSSRLQQVSDAISQSDNRLIQWRKQYPLDALNARNALYGNQSYRKIVDQTFDVMIRSPHIFTHENLEDQNRKQQRLAAVQMMKTLHRQMPVPPTIYKTDIHPVSLVAHALYYLDGGQSVKSYISYFLYAKTLYFFSAQNNNVQKKIAEQAMALKHIGCFGLTQIGHGSNVKGILTEARYSHKDNCFYIHSPSDAAMKYWIGALAETATMSVIWAQLVIDGVKYGPQPFIVPVRDLKTHQTFTGVTIGDCGHKNGSNSIDNGYVLFNNYKIPKDYCLSKYSGVDEQGKYFNTFKNSQKLFGFYMAPLSVGRSFVNANCIAGCFNALAVAVRYACSRKQFGPEKNKQQLLIDYPLTKYRIMPLISTAFVYFYGGVGLLRKYDQNVKQLLNPSNKIIKQFHAVTGPFKAMSSWFASKAFTQCRAILGGHGYSSYSGLDRMYNSHDINQTWQGDNNMLLQQTTKYILKTFGKIQRGKSFEGNSLKFLAQQIQIPEDITEQNFNDLNLLENILKSRVIELCQSCLNSMLEQKGQGIDPMEIWNQSQPYFGNNLSIAYGQLSYFKQIMDTLEKFDNQWKQVAKNCLRMFVLNVLEKNCWGTLEQRKIIQSKIIQLCDYLAPRSVSIVDTFAAPQPIIGSAFANKNGGMQDYITRLFTGHKTFERKQWWKKFVQTRGV